MTPLASSLSTLEEWIGDVASWAMGWTKEGALRGAEGEWRVEKSADSVGARWEIALRDVGAALSLGLLRERLVPLLLADRWFVSWSEGDGFATKPVVIWSRAGLLPSEGA